MLRDREHGFLDESAEHGQVTRVLDVSVQGHCVIG